MTASIPVFGRHLSPAFVRGLHELVEDPTGQWWRDVLAHPDLKLAIRTDAIDVYHRGAAIFRIAPGEDGRVVPRTHFKYLMRRRQGHATIAADGKTFVYDPGETSWTTYEKGKTLDEMVAASRRFAGAEKSDLHPLIMHPSVIDVEIAFRGSAAEGLIAADASGTDEQAEGALEPLPLSANGEPKIRQDRLDAASLEDRDGSLWLVFHEAKHFKNPELRAGPAFAPPVSTQIARYRQAIATNIQTIRGSYSEVCGALRELSSMRAKLQAPGAAAPAELDPLVFRVADGETLHVDGEPRLIVFGFDDDQKNGPTWTHHRQRLEEAKLTVYAVGKPDRKAAAAAFARRAS